MTSVVGQFSETVELSNYERDGLKAFNNSSAHLLKFTIRTQASDL